MADSSQECLDHDAKTIGKKTGCSGHRKTRRDFAASLPEAGAFLAETRYRDGEARRKGLGAGEGTGRVCDDRKPQGGAWRGHRASGREAASSGRSVERNCLGVE